MTQYPDRLFVRQPFVHVDQPAAREGARAPRPAELSLVEIPIRDLPLYSPDNDADYPPVARVFKKAISDVDAVLFVTPEYNRSIPGGLKNASTGRAAPWGQNSFARKRRA